MTSRSTAEPTRDGANGRRTGRAAGRAAAAALAVLLGAVPAVAGDRPATCGEQIDAVAKALVDAGYRIRSRHDPNERRPGVITAHSLDPDLHDVSVLLRCQPELRYEIQGAGVLGLLGGTRKRVDAAIRARLEGREPVPEAGAAVAGEAPAMVRMEPRSVAEDLSRVGVSAFEVEVRNRTKRPLVVQAGAVTLVTPEGHVLGAIDAGEVANRLATSSRSLDPRVRRRIESAELRPARLLPGEVTRGVVYFDRASGGRAIIHALTDDLAPVPLQASVRASDPGV